MEWSRAKTILIWLFIVVNIFLVYILINNNKQEEIDKSKFHEVLVKNNIEMDLNKFTRQKSNIFVPEFSFVTEENCYTLVKSGSKEATLTVLDNKIYFADPHPENNSFVNVNASNAVSKILPFLKEIGIDKFVFSKNIKEENGVIQVEFGYKINQYEVYHSTLTFTLSNKGILKCEGVLYIPIMSTGYSYEVNNYETIVLQLGKNNKDNRKIKVEDLKFGLYILNYEGAVTVQAVPVYEITTSDNIYIYDARIGVDAEDSEIIY